MRRSGGRRGLSAFQAGLIALVLILIGTFLAFTKDIPFTKPFELKATFENAPPLQKNQAVRIAGVDVGKVSKIEPVGGDSPAVTVTMKLDDEALPIYENARVKVRPRIFFEGNLFFDIDPGTSSSGELDDGGTIPASQTSAPVQIDQVLGSLQADTRQGLQKLLEGYGGALNGEPEPGEDDDQDPDVQGDTAGQALNDSLEYSAEALRGGAIVNQALLGTQMHDLSKLVAGQQRIFAALSRHEGSLKDLITNFNVTMSALADEQGNLRETIAILPDLPRSCRTCSRRRTPRSTS
jgi:phospholipid/cholesterol/gamma-HCH transport system substrate-binding protein